MFSFAGIVALMFFIFVRPMEIYPPLQEIPLIYIFFGLAVFGLVVDLRLRLIRPQPTPQLLFVILFFGWSILTSVAQSGAPVDQILMISILFVWFYLISHGLQGLRPFRALVGVLVALSLFLALVGVHQNFAKLGCVQIEGLVAGLPSSHGIPDGRTCKTENDCYNKDAEPGKEYLCEKVGLFGTSSITRRVRYLGIFQDPNDLSLTIAVTLPFLIVFVQLKRTRRRLLIALLAAAIISLCVLYSKSRGGQLVMISVAAVYFVHRFKLRGLLISLVAGAALFVVIAGARGEEASQSSAERIEHMHEGMLMFKYSPVLGVGAEQYTEHHYMTAHNAYVLTVAETGAVGMFFWLAILYLSMKIPVVAYLRYRKRVEMAEVRYWSVALIAALVGTYLGIFFLSFTWHYMLWCYLALSGAFYRALKLHDDDFKVSFRFLDFAAVSVLTVGLIAGLFVLTTLLNR